MMNWNGHMTTVGWIFSILWIVVILALVVATIVWIARELSVRRDRGATPVSAPAIRDRRLASGEINAQHEQLRQTIGTRPDSL